MELWNNIRTVENFTLNRVLLSYPCLPGSQHALSGRLPASGASAAHPIPSDDQLTENEKIVDRGRAYITSRILV